MVDTSTSCDELYQDKLYDYWVVSHTILPFTLATLGFVEPLLILFLVYAWESLELLIRDCTNNESAWSHPESRMNSQIVDPVSGFVGVAVGMAVARAWGVNPGATAPKNLGVQSLFVAASILPTFLFFDWFYNRSLHHIFPFSVIGVLLVTRTVEASIGWYDLMLYLYVLLIHFSVTLADQTNSFMLSFGVSLGITLMGVVVAAYRRNLQTDLAVALSDR
jgi:hypothetical protein